MCGIVGYIGNRQAQSILLEGMTRIEYRGYDSSGIAVLCTNTPQTVTQIRRSTGKLTHLKTLIEKSPCQGELGIGHTRWATHGKPSEENAHPHSYQGITLVHNGIIENFRELKAALIKNGHQFSSETDSEVLSHLIAAEKQKSASLLEAVKKTISRIQGAYAFVVMDEATPNQLIAVKQACPLVIGHCDHENFVVSDFSAALSHTRRFTILQEGDIALVTAHQVQVYDNNLSLVERPEKIIDWSLSAAEKEGFKHFMLKEIFEQPTAVTDALRGRLNFAHKQPELDGINAAALRHINRICIVACGTSYHSGLVAKYAFEEWLRVPVEVDIASEYRYRKPVVDPHTLVIGISQSGETADTLAALQEAHRLGAPILGVCNVVDSAIARLCDTSVGTLYTHAGPEISVASTKAFVTQVVVLYLLGLQLAAAKDTLNGDVVAEHMNDLLSLPRLLEDFCKSSDAIREVAKKYATSRDMLFLGRGHLYPIALEGALKMKELSYMHAEGYAAGEMKHGPIALIDENMPVVVLAIKGPGYEKIVSNLEETRARGGRIIAVCEQQDTELISICDDVIELPAAGGCKIPILAAVPMQLLAYHVADIRGTDVDQPRNLAKSVTVE